MLVSAGEEEILHVGVAKPGVYYVSIDLRKKLLRET